MRASVSSNCIDTAKSPFHEPAGRARPDAPGRAACGTFPNAQGSARPAFLSCFLFLWPLLDLGAAVTPGEINPDATNIPALLPPKAELPPGFWEQYGFWVAVGVVLFLAAVAGLVWYLTKAHPPVPEPPEKTARQALQRLSEQPEDGLVISRVSQVLRHYVASAFSLPPGELTTAEFCRQIAGNDQLGELLSEEISGFLRLCDERKFSAASASTPLAAAVQGLRFVDMAEAQRARFAELHAAQLGRKT